jgi:hypothetical protein
LARLRACHRVPLLFNPWAPHGHATPQCPIGCQILVEDTHPETCEDGPVLHAFGHLPLGL